MAGTARRPTGFPLRAVISPARWIGISSPAIGLHGTPAPETIGTRASHGCIRLRIRHAEWLYDVVARGDPVVIV